MLLAPALLEETYDLGLFQSGNDILDEWLCRHARSNQVRSASRTYVVAEDQRVIGYYCLASGGLDLADAPGPIRRDMSPYP